MCVLRYHQFQAQSGTANSWQPNSLEAPRIVAVSEVVAFVG